MGKSGGGVVVTWPRAFGVMQARWWGWSGAMGWACALADGCYLAFGFFAAGAPKKEVMDFMPFLLTFARLF